MKRDSSKMTARFLTSPARECDAALEQDMLRRSLVIHSFEHSIMIEYGWFGASGGVRRCSVCIA